MSYYKCGHNRDSIVINSDPLTVSAYLTWKDENDYSMCFKCWAKEQRDLEKEQELKELKEVD